MLSSRVEPDLHRPFVELDVRVGKGPGEMVLADPSTGRATTGETFRFEAPLSAWEVEAVSSRHVVKQSGASGASGQPDAPRDLGGRLFDALFSGACSRLYAEAVHTAEAQGRGLCVVVQARDRDTSALPWELLFDRSLLSDFVARIPGQGVVRRTGGVPARAGVPTTAAEPTIVSASTRHREPDAGPVRHLPDALRLDVRPDPVDSGGRLLELVRDIGPVLLHLAVDSAPSSRSGAPGMRIGDRRISAEGLVDTAADGPVPPVLVLDGAHTDQLAVVLSEIVPVTVGFRGSPSAGAVTAFLDGFYQGIADGLSVAGASSRGRGRVAYLLPGSSQWASAVVVASHSDPVLPRSSAPAPSSSVEAELRSPGGDSLERQLLRAQLAIDRATLSDLTRRWGTVEEALRPRTIQRQLESTEQRIAEQRTTLEEQR
jgi:hypothetical protein